MTTTTHAATDRGRHAGTDAFGNRGTDVSAIDPRTRLGDLITSHPELARELDRRRLDYCCGGSVTLAEACLAAGLDVTRVVAELAAVAAHDPAPAAWSTMGPVELVDHIIGTHHRYLWRELPRLTEQLAKVVTVHQHRHPELVAVADTFAVLRADLEPHLLKEERVLFPIVRALADADPAAPPAFHCGSVANPIAVMLAEHDTAGALLERLRELTDGYRAPADACASYVACYRALEGLEHDTHQHVHAENQALFPMAVELERRLGR